MSTRVLVVPLNEYGRRIGEKHQNARIPDATVDLIREWHEDDGLGPLHISITLNISLSTIKKICYYTRRAQTPFKWKRIRVPVNN